jgi:cytosine/uracil/thiamine/allantoin permease
VYAWFTGTLIAGVLYYGAMRITGRARDAVR